MDLMMHEMVGRDKNRCGVIVWSLSNETSPSAARDNALITSPINAVAWILRGLLLR